MNDNDSMDFVAAIVFLVVALLGLIGWVMNIVKLVTADVFAGMEIARVAGIFVAPLGAVLGWF